MKRQVTWNRVISAICVSLNACSATLTMTMTMSLFRTFAAIK